MVRQVKLEQDLVDSCGIPVSFVCSALGEACQKAGSKGNVNEIHRRAPSFSSLICLYLFMVQRFKCRF